MKRILFFMILAITAGSIVIFMLTSGTNKRFHIEKPEVLKTAKAYPICFLMDKENKFNPSLPYLNEIDEFFVQDQISLIENGSQMTLFFDKGKQGEISYEIINPFTKEIISKKGLKAKEKTTEEEGFKINIQLDSLIAGQEYVMKLIFQEKQEPVYYYQRIMIASKNQADVLKAVNQAHRLMFEGDKGIKKYISTKGNGGEFYHASHESSEDILLWEDFKDFVKMNDPIPEIISYTSNLDCFEVKMRFTVAVRKEYAFEYWEFTEVYKVQSLEKEITIKEFSRYGNRKNEPYFDQDDLCWIVDEGFEQTEKQHITSENKQFYAFVYKNEIYLGDKNYNTLTKVFGFDLLDNDYLMDESNHHKIQLVEVDEKGNIDYLIVGYMAGGDYAGYNGILAKHYNHNKGTNENSLFVKMSYGYEELGYYFEKFSYYNKEYKQFYVRLGDELFGLDFNQEACKNILTLPSQAKFTDEGLIYSTDSSLKDNMGIQLINLNEKTIPKILSVNYENTNSRILGMIENQVIIGTYKEKNTFEYLDGRVFYPYEEIQILDFSGKIKEKIVAQEGRYIGDLIINEYEGTIYATDYYFLRQTNNNAIASKVSYEKIENREIYRFAAKNDEEEEAILGNRLKDGVNKISIRHAGVSLLDTTVPIATNKRKMPSFIEVDIKNNYESFEVYKGNDLIATARTVGEVLKITKEYPDTILYQNKGHKRKRIYNSLIKKKSILLELPIILQRPELIRGCESTALAMFLSYNKNEAISKIEIAEKLLKDETPMEIINGVINFGDMHKGFVGSITDRTQPGLGVYIEPLYDLAKKYVEGVYNITGSSFEQVLSMVSEERPVLVIMPANYNKVPERVLQHWKTPSGYMEVTYLEHSAVIVGYDGEYVYLNDPQYHQVIKRKRDDFKAGWESMGSQGMVVIK